MTNESGSEIDFVDLARRTSRSEFVARCPFPFLLGRDTLQRPTAPQRTRANSGIDVLQRVREMDAAKALISEVTPPPTEIRRMMGARKPLVLPVRKRQQAFPSMITVGRTANNDVVIPDVSISKFHAFFRMQGDAIELADAGSRNGTAIGQSRLPPKGDARAVSLGDTLWFGKVELRLFDAGGCWDAFNSPVAI